MVQGALIKGAGIRLVELHIIKGAGGVVLEVVAEVLGLEVHGLSGGHVVIDVARAHGAVTDVDDQGAVLVVVAAGGIVGLEGNGDGAPLLGVVVRLEGQEVQVVLAVLGAVIIERGVIQGAAGKALAAYLQLAPEVVVAAGGGEGHVDDVSSGAAVDLLESVVKILGVKGHLAAGLYIVGHIALGGAGDGDLQNAPDLAVVAVGDEVQRQGAVLGVVVRLEGRGIQGILAVLGIAVVEFIAGEIAPGKRPAAADHRAVVAVIAGGGKDHILQCGAAAGHSAVKIPEIAGVEGLGFAGRHGVFNLVGGGGGDDGDGAGDRVLPAAVLGGVAQGIVSAVGAGLKGYAGELADGAAVRAGYLSAGGLGAAGVQRAVVGVARAELDRVGGQRKSAALAGDLARKIGADIGDSADAGVLAGGAHAVHGGIGGVGADGIRGAHNLGSGEIRLRAGVD